MFGSRKRVWTMLGQLRDEYADGRIELDELERRIAEELRNPSPKGHLAELDHFLKALYTLQIADKESQAPLHGKPLESPVEAANERRVQHRHQIQAGNDERSGVREE